ncbi:MAG TPA: AIR synthase-related protein, partial [Gemmatimonadales bacterium]|nr:AIR synthase-related protein [Gemmatimonadales bacterium]
LDLSDGLAGDARHLAAASRVGLEIELERIPCAPGVPRAAARAGQPAEAFAAEGGEDYELLAALPEGFTDADAAGFEREQGIPLTRVGRVVAGEGVRFLLGGRPAELRGHDHFA